MDLAAFRKTAKMAGHAPFFKADRLSTFRAGFPEQGIFHVRLAGLVGFNH